MRRVIFFVVLCWTHFGASGQSRSTRDWTDFGSSHVNKWMQIAPAKMGPNALPVPSMDYARIGKSSGIEVGAHAHVMKGDTAVNSYLSLNWVVVPEKVEVRVWGNPSETFRMNNEVRDERQVYYDDSGWITHQGDIWVSTRIQLLKDHRRLPDFILQYSLKTTSGSMKHGRYSDAGVHHFYAATGKSFYPGTSFPDEIRVAGLGGFYVWQTNKVEMAQDEGPLLEAGIELRQKNLSFFGEAGGYFGADAYDYIGVTGDNDPLVYRLRLLRTGSVFEWKAEYMAGVQDYHYHTFKLGMVWRFNSYLSDAMK